MIMSPKDGRGFSKKPLMVFRAWLKSYEVYLKIEIIKEFGFFFLKNVEY